MAVPNFYTNSNGKNFYDIGDAVTLGVFEPTAEGIASTVQTAIGILASGAGPVNIYLPTSDALITITEPFPLVSGLRYYGSFPQFTHSTSVPDNTVNFVSGSGFYGDGTFPGFQAQDLDGNPLDASKEDPDANFSTTGIHECGIYNVWIENCSTGISSGNHNQCGPLYSEFRNIVVKGCTTGWGVNVCNPQHCEFTRIWTLGCLYGQRYAADVALAVLQPGNSTVTQLFDNPTSDLSVVQRRKHRGIVFEAKGGANLNEMFGYRLQVNNFAKSSTTYTTATGGTSEFTLQAGKGVELEVGMPIKFTHAGGNGNITVGQTYYVYSISTDTIKVSAGRFSAAITGAFNTSTAFTTYGHGNMEWIGGTVGSGGSAGTSGTVTNGVFMNIDVEGVCQSAVSLENVSGCSYVINELFANPGTEQHIVLRTSQPNHFNVTNTFTSDIDGSSIQCMFFGTRDMTNSLQNTAQWMGRNSTSSRFTLGLGNAVPTVRGGNFEHKEPSGGQFTYPLCPIGQRVLGNLGSADATTLNAGQGGVVYCTTSGAGAITWTLPTISDAVVGLPFKIRNNRAGGAGATLTLTAATGQPINNISGKLSVELAAPSGTTTAGVSLLACSDGSSGFFWDAVLEAGATIP